MSSFEDDHRLSLNEDIRDIRPRSRTRVVCPRFFKDRCRMSLNEDKMHNAHQLRRDACPASTSPIGPNSAP